MNVSKRKSIYTLCAIMIFLFGGNAFGSDDPSSDPLLPAGLVMEDVFKPGLGSSVGKVEVVEGQVVIIHADELRGYQARKDLPLYTGDTIVTLEKGRTKFKLNDESTMTMSPETKLVINESVYDPAEKSRSSYISMSLGKARFLVMKLADFKRSVFKVKTPTAICGVRGSDFITFVTERRTEITALFKTLLEVWSEATPEAKPMLVKDFERAFVEDGAPWKEKVSAEEIEQMKKLFEMIQEMAGPEEEELTLEEIEEVISGFVEEVHEDEVRGEGEPELPEFPLPPE